MDLKNVSAEEFDNSDSAISAWEQYLTNLSRFQETKNALYLGRKNASLLEVFRLFQEGSLDRAAFTEFTDDAVVGGFSDIHPFDLSADYSKTNSRPVFIKKMSIKDAGQAYTDSRYAQQFTREKFYLAPAIDIATYQELDFALYVTRLIPGPNIAEIFRVLNSRIDQGSPEDAKVKDAILKKNLEDLIFWQDNFSAMLPPDVLDIQTQPSTILNRYKSNTNQVITNAGGLMYRQPNLNLAISDVERELFTLALELYDKLNLTPERIARIRDDTETNSGLALGRIKFDTDNQLYEALIDAITKKSENGDAAKNGVILTTNNRIISYDKISALYSHWDTATGSFGHFLEDFWRIIDSFSLRLDDYKKITRYREYLEMKFGDQAKRHDDELDAQLVRFFRNFRHRDVVASVFAKNNEERYRIGAKTEIERDKKRANYVLKAAHYLAMAAFALDNAISSYEIGGSEAQRLKRDFEHTETLLKTTDTEPQKDLQDRLDGPVKGITRVVQQTSDPAIRELGQFYGFRYIVEKMRYYPIIDFNQLSPPKQL